MKLVGALTSDWELRSTVTGGPGGSPWVSGATFDESRGRLQVALAAPVFGGCVETVAGVTEALIRAGCVYLCTSSEDCERVHDICDEMIGDGERSMDEVGLIMTTWHADEPLDEALWFFLRSTIPADNFVDRCRTSLVLTVGLDRDRMQTIERALADPEGFSSEIENRPDSW